MEDCRKKIQDFAEENREKLCKYYSKFKAMHDTFELREKVLLIRDKFYIVGFVPAADAERFKKYFEDLKSVSLIIKPCTESGDIEPPVKAQKQQVRRAFLNVR